jgi:hypothetical protein
MGHIVKSMDFNLFIVINNRIIILNENNTNSVRKRQNQVIVEDLPSSEVMEGKKKAQNR